MFGVNTEPHMLSGQMTLHRPLQLQGEFLEEAPELRNGLELLKMPFSTLSLCSPQSTFLPSRNSIVPKEALQSRTAVHKLSHQLLLLFTLLEIPPNAPGILEHSDR